MGRVSLCYSIVALPTCAEVAIKSVVAFGRGVLARCPARNHVALGVLGRGFARCRRKKLHLGDLPRTRQGDGGQQPPLFQLSGRPHPVAAPCLVHHEYVAPSQPVPFLHADLGHPHFGRGILVDRNAAHVHGPSGFQAQPRLPLKIATVGLRLPLKPLAVARPDRDGRTLLAPVKRVVGLPAAWWKNNSQLRYCNLSQDHEDELTARIQI